MEFRDAFGGGRYLAEYWDDAREARDAAQIPVASAATVSGINARLAVAGAIEGTVTDATGRADRRGAGPGRQPGAVTPTRARGSRSPTPPATTAWAGCAPASYEVPLPEGRTTIMRVLGRPPRAARPRPGAGGRRRRTTTGIDAELAAAAHLIGTVTDEVTGAPLAGIRVQAWERVRGYWATGRGRLPHHRSGRSLRPRPARRAAPYRLEFTGRSRAGTSRRVVAGPALATGRPTDIAVADGATVSRNVRALTRPAHITGRVVGTQDGPAAETRTSTVYRYAPPRGTAGCGCAGVGAQHRRGGPVRRAGGCPPGPTGCGSSPTSSAYLAEFWRRRHRRSTRPQTWTSRVQPARTTSAPRGSPPVATSAAPSPDPTSAPLRYASGHGLPVRRRRGQAAATATVSDVYTDDAGPLRPGRSSRRVATGCASSAWSYEPDEGNEEWWDGAATLEDATDIVLRARQGVDGIDAELASGGAIARPGDRGPTAPASRTSASTPTARRATGTSTTTPTPPTRAAATRCPRLPDGDLPDQVHRRPHRSRGRRSGPVDAPDLGSAEDVVVADGRLVRRNAVLDPASHLTGSVTGPDGEPMSGVDGEAVRARRRQRALAADRPRRPGLHAVRTGPTAPARSTWPGSAPAPTASASRPTTALEAREFWDDVPSVDRATDIVVGVGATSSGLDAQLDDGGHITGRVTDRTGSVLSQVQVDAYTFDPGPGEWIRVSSAYTDDLGRYDLDDLGGGTYRLGFHDVEGVLADEFWREQPAIGTATDVVVPAGGTVTGKNEVLDQLGATLTGTVRDADGSRLDARVVVYREGRTGRYTPLPRGRDQRLVRPRRGRRLPGGAAAAWPLPAGVRRGRPGVRGRVLGRRRSPGRRHDGRARRRPDGGPPGPGAQRAA